MSVVIHVLCWRIVCCLMRGVRHGLSVVQCVFVLLCDICCVLCVVSCVLYVECCAVNVCLLLCVVFVVFFCCVCLMCVLCLVC